MPGPKIFSLFPSPVKGVILATLSALSFSLTTFAAKKLSPDIPTSLVVFVRAGLGLAFFIPFFVKKRHEFLPTQHLPFYVLRVLLNASAVFCTYYTYRHLPIGLATALGMTGPLFTTILSAIVLREKLDKIQWICLLIGYGGALFIIKPHTFILELAILTSLLANLMAGGSIITVRVLSKYDPPLVIMGYTNLGFFLVSALFSYNSWQIISLNNMCIIALMALLGLFSQYCLVSSLKQSSPSFLAPFEYTRLLFSFGLGFVYFGEIPDVYKIIGSIIIIISNYMITYQEKYK